jgi:glycosyltransferase involved in cell wall biosynthesis
VCITRNRRQWLPQAIRCFQQQTYLERELLIVSEGEDVMDLLPEQGRLRLIHIEEGRTIGEKRNLAVHLAEGSVIAHWDDDDWSAPTRLADQVARLAACSVAVTGYSQMFFTDGQGWWLYRGQRSHGIGTSLCYRKTWWETHPFKHLQSGEDYPFVTRAFSRGQASAVEAGELMVASVHRRNTSPRSLTGPNWLKSTPPESLRAASGVVALQEIARLAA